MTKGTVVEVAQEPGHEFPVVIANMPASSAERRVALALVVFLFITFGIVAPFARVPLPSVYAFIPVIQTVVCIAELVTAILLFAQYSIQPQLGLLALASGYIFSGLFAFLQTLAFPGAYAPSGLIGDPLISTVYLFCLWHVALPTAVLVYALSADTGATTDKSTRITIGITVVSVLAVTAILTWVVTAGAKYLPPTFVDGTRQAPITSYMTGFIWLLSAAGLLALFKYRRTSLAVWLMVAVFATLPDLTLSTVMTTVRYTLGWYTARSFALIASCTVLAALLVETTMLYARLANAIILLRRESAHRLLTVDVATAAIAHELSQPLGAITLNSSTALISLESNPPDLLEARACLTANINDTERANEIVSSIRALFKIIGKKEATIEVNHLVRQALRMMEHDLHAHGVTVSTQFQESLPQIVADPIQLQHVIMNIIKNGIEAMAVSDATTKEIRMVTSQRGNSVVSLSVQDSGSGITSENETNIFDPFFTTKSSGLGLGLSISRKIIEDHGGNLLLTQSGSNGCIFEITLPGVATSGEDLGRA